METVFDPLMGPDSLVQDQDKPLPWPGVGRTALVATANAERRARVISVLSDLGCAVTGVSHGVELLEQLSDALIGEPNTSPRPSIIIADALLAGCTGLSLLAGLRDLHWQTPIILFAERHRKKLWVDAWQAGATAIFSEPIDFRRLAELSGLLLDPHSGELTTRAFQLARSTLAGDLLAPGAADEVPGTSKLRLIH